MWYYLQLFRTDAEIDAYVYLSTPFDEQNFFRYDILTCQPTFKVT